MSDLISRSDVLDLLYGIFDKYKMSTDKNTSIGKSFGTDVFEEIRNMPTAYSVDKVVYELDKSSNYYECEEQGREHVQMVDLTEAIEIVKQVCVSDDVCEWHKVKHGNAYKSNTHAEIYDSRVLDWCKCPYCGNKRKVVA